MLFLILYHKYYDTKKNWLLYCIINMTNDEYPMININDIITITVIIVITYVIYL